MVVGCFTAACSASSASKCYRVSSECLVRVSEHLDISAQRGRGNFTYDFMLHQLASVVAVSKHRVVMRPSQCRRLDGNMRRSTMAKARSCQSKSHRCLRDRGLCALRWNTAPWSEVGAVVCWCCYQSSATTLGQKPRRYRKIVMHVCARMCMFVCMCVWSTCHW